MDASGAEFQERARTKIVSRHGACLELKHRLLVSSSLQLSIPNAKRNQTCRVVSVNSEQAPYETGIELEQAENFWGVQFPPDDWEAPQQIQMQSDPPPRVTPLSIAENDGQQIVTVALMLNALISVLQEKGIVTSAELAKTLKEIGEAS
jgi:hypothetical protein